MSLKLRGVLRLRLLIAAVPGNGSRRRPAGQPAPPATARRLTRRRCRIGSSRSAARPRSFRHGRARQTAKFGLTGFPAVQHSQGGNAAGIFRPARQFRLQPPRSRPVQARPGGQASSRSAKPSDYTELNGLADVHYALQVGAFAEFWPVTWLRLRGEVRQGFGGETGVTGDLFLDAVVPVGQFRFSSGPRHDAAIGGGGSPYFSITPAQSAGIHRCRPAERLPVYQRRRRSLFLRCRNADSNISSTRNGRLTPSSNMSG